MKGSNRCLAVGLAGLLFVGMSCRGGKSESEPAPVSVSVTEGFSSLSEEDYNTRFKAEPVFGTVIRIGYDGGLCQAAIPVAHEKGFFAAEGLQTVLTRSDSASDAIAGKKIDTSAGMIAEWLKPVENGVDIVFTVGLHTGCTSAVVLSGSSITSFAAAKERGKTNVGIPTRIGSPQHNIGYRFVAHENAGLLSTDFNWRPFDGSQLLLVLQNGAIDIAVVSDQLAQGWVDQGLVTRIHSLSEDPDFINESCCVMGLNGDFLRANPITGEKISRAVYRAALWIGESEANKHEAAQLLLDGSHISGTIEYAITLMNYYQWGVDQAIAEKSLFDAVREYRELGVLAADTDANVLHAQMWRAVDLDRPAAY